MTIEITSYDRINRTPALRLAAQGWHHLLQSGLTEDVALLHWSHKAIVAWDAEVPHEAGPIGVIVWDEQEHDKSAFIVLGYVLPFRRHEGIYKHMYAHLKGIAKERGLVRIAGMTQANNESMRETARRAGRREQAILLVEDIA